MLDKANVAWSASQGLIPWIDPMDWQGVKLRGKRPTIKNTFRAIAHNFSSYCVLKVSRFLMLCRDFYAQVANPWAIDVHIIYIKSG